MEMRKWDADREREIKAKKKRAEKEPLDDETYLVSAASVSLRVMVRAWLTVDLRPRVWPSRRPTRQTSPR